MGHVSTFRDDPEYAPLIKTFVARLPWYVNGIEASLASGNLPEAQKFAHQLKGAGGGYGFPEITRLAAAMEQAVKGGGDVQGTSAAVLAYLRGVEGFAG